MKLKPKNKGVAELKDENLADSWEAPRSIRIG